MVRFDACHDLTCPCLILERDQLEPTERVGAVGGHFSNEFEVLILCVPLAIDVERRLRS